LNSEKAGLAPAFLRRIVMVLCRNRNCFRLAPRR
jgi:hypothetical protein